jgi:hypothetical protein
MSLLSRLASLLTGRDAAARLDTLERAVKKLGDAQRDHSATVQAKLAAVADRLEEQPTAKDLREVRQALRGLTPQPEDKRLVEVLEQIAASGRPVLIGPWSGEVGFELLYWIPFVEWARTQMGLAPERELIVSRGGVRSWYGRSAGQYADVFSFFSPDEFRAATADEKRKRRHPGAFDDRVIDAVVRKCGLEQVDLLHPGLMYRAFAPFWSDEAGYARIDQYTRHRLLDPPVGSTPPGLPSEYVAVRFYFSESFPATPENRAFAQSVVASLASRTPVVLLNPGFEVDEHQDWTPDTRDRIVTIAGSVTPEENLAVQSAVISGARAFVGTYGGYSYLAPLYKVPSIAFYSRMTFKLHHLHVAQRVFERIGAARLMPFDVADASLVQNALGTVVTA